MVGYSIVPTKTVFWKGSYNKTHLEILINQASVCVWLYCSFSQNCVICMFPPL